jgi:pimeloyl-ACP methyl ester carboxylesterase
MIESSARGTAQPILVLGHSIWFVVTLALSVSRSLLRPASALFLLSSCSALALTGQARQAQAVPRSGYVHSAGARLHYLEWGSGGPQIILLPGYSLTAHAFESVGTALAAKNHVVALTPRGFGESDAPQTSVYRIATLVDDLRALMDSLNIDRATIVGHSLSGSVAAAFAIRYPMRVSHLILLDSYPYFASAGGDSIAALDPVETPPFRGDTTYVRVARYLRRYRFVPWNAAMNADLRAKPLGAEAVRRASLTRGYIEDQWKSPPDLTQLTVSALQVCALPSVASEYPWLATTAPAFAKAERYISRISRPFAEQLCDRFKSTVPGGRVRRREGSHYLFFTQPDVTVQIVELMVREH